MGRRTSSGRIGAPTFGGLLADAQTITSDDNKDITLDPTGTGIVKIDGHVMINSANELRFADTDSSNYIALVSPSTVSSDLVFTLPTADGSNGQVLQTDGNGALSFTDSGIQIGDETLDSTTLYPMFSGTTSGTLTSAEVSSTKFTFQPSTGTLTADKVAATEIQETSSAVFKENFRSIDGGLEKIRNLTGYIYDRKDGSKYNEPGLIAEQVAEVIPELVTYDDDNRPYALLYTKLSAYILEAIKDLDKELHDLKGRLNG